MEIDKTIQSELARANFDSHSPTPLYYQAYSFLTNLISSELFQIGDLLPPEIELAKLLNISRQTLRQTMNLLVEEGLVERFSGRGTFIREKSLRNEFFMDRSFSQQMTDLGKITHSKIIECIKGKIDKNAPGLLHTNFGAPCLYLTRLRYVDQIPVVLQKAVILTERCPDIAAHDFTKESLFQIFTEIYKLMIAEIYHEVNAVIVPEKYTQLLEINPASPVLLERSITYLSNNEPIEATTSYYRSDKYKYSVRFRYMNSKSYKHTPAQGH
jgi:GntR family transcriptional regulator